MPPTRVPREGVCGALGPSAASSAKRKARPRARGSTIWRKGGDAGVGARSGQRGSFPTPDPTVENTAAVQPLTQRAPGQLSGFRRSPVRPGPPLRLRLCYSTVHPAMLPVQTLAKAQSQVPVFPQEPLIPECSWQLRSLLPWPRFGPGSSPAFDAPSSVPVTGSFSFTIFFKRHPSFHP